MNNKNNEILTDIEFIVKTSIYNMFITNCMIFINFRFIKTVKEIKSEYQVDSHAPTTSSVQFNVQMKVSSVICTKAPLSVQYRPNLYVW
jgi:hypothetical protein